MTDDTPKPWIGISAIAEMAATMMRAAAVIPIGTMRTACDLQKRAIEVMESFVPGMDAQAGQTSGGVRHATPAPTASVSTSPAPGTTGAATGWGPVTPQNPQTGWGPIPR